MQFFDQSASLSHLRPALSLEKLGMSVSSEVSADARTVGLGALVSMPFILAFRNFVHDKIRLTATIAGLTFAVILIGVQLGLYLGVRKIISATIDHTNARAEL